MTHPDQDTPPADTAALVAALRNCEAQAKAVQKRLAEKDAEIERLRELAEQIHAGRIRCAWLWDDQFEQVRCWPIDADGFQFGESFATALEALEAAAAAGGKDG